MVVVVVAVVALVAVVAVVVVAAVGAMAVAFLMYVCFRKLDQNQNFSIFMSNLVGWLLLVLQPLCCDVY